MTENKTIYLDNNATTRVAPEVREVMLPYFEDKYGNPSSMHRFGGKIKRDIETAREQVATSINATDPSEIYFTGCGTESDNLAIQGFIGRHGSASRLITSKVEHPAVGHCCAEMKKRGTYLTELSVDEQGLLNLDELREAPMDHNTLVSLMWANNETGVLFPIQEAAEIVKERGAFFHSDAVQAVGKVPIDVQKTPLDMLALSGHKLHAPKGVGAFYLRKGTPLESLLYGGHQENGMRGGTENVAFIVALGKACELAGARMEDENTRVRAMRDRLEKGLLESCTGAYLNGAPDYRLPNTSNVSFEYIEGEAILLLLDERGIAASSGSACTSGSLEPSHVMRAMGKPYTLAHSSTRFSLSVYNTNEDIDAVIEVMPGIVERLRKISPFVK